jgi:hypothetical protein
MDKEKDGKIGVIIWYTLLWVKKGKGGKGKKKDL